MQLAYGGDGVGHGRPFVGTVALDAREPQREPAGILTTRLDVVEGDLDDELGAHVHRVPPVVAPDLELEQLLGLPREHLVRHPLERLAEHHEPAGVGVAGAQAEIREPAAAAPVAPFGGEYHEVERSEEHTSELQSPCNLVCRLLLEKKKKNQKKLKI